MMGETSSLVGKLTEKTYDLTMQKLDEWAENYEAVPMEEMNITA